MEHPIPDDAQKHEGTFALEIDYRPGRDAPSRVFLALSNMIEAIERADRVLAHSLVAEMTPVLLLEDIERGSIRAWFRSIVKDLPDDALQSGEVKRLVGHYLLKGKRAIISWADKHPTVESREAVEELRQDLRALAEQTGVNRIPAYTAPKIIDLVEVATEFKEAAVLLNEDENMRFVTDGETLGVSKSFAVATDRLEELVTQHVYVNRVAMLLKVKKPDFLGSSQWELRHGPRAITATIEDREWIDRFHARDPATVIMPGDAIEATVRVDASYGYDGELVRENHAIEHIIRVVKPPEQMTLDTGRDDGK